MYFNGVFEYAVPVIIMGRKIVLIVIFLIIGFFIGFMANSKTTVVYEEFDTPIGMVRFNSFGESPRFASTMVPAVDENKSGLATILKVEAAPGSGRILANIDKMLIWTDTQNSIRTARLVASERTGADVSRFDIIYTIETDATAIEGPSAGAALTAVTIAALSGKKMKTDVMITGAINHDGTIGPVSNVLEKAIAAKGMGIKTLLVPLTQGTMDKFETKRYCEEIGNSSICLDEDIPQKLDISEVAGIKVIEVVDIDEALKYLFEQ
jgi:predicted S18 family serine protease